MLGKILFRNDCFETKWSSKRGYLQVRNCLQQISEGNDVERCECTNKLSGRFCTTCENFGKIEQLEVDKLRDIIPSVEVSKMDNVPQKNFRGTSRNTQPISMKF